MSRSAARFLVTSPKLVAVAGVRVIGGLLTFAGVIVGIRVLGVDEFGTTIVLLGFGVAFAVPLTCLERLVLRQAAQDEPGSALQLVRLSAFYGIAIITFGAIASWTLHLRDSESWLAPFAAASAAASWSFATNAQGFMRGSGHLMWGQVPNEVFRPILTILGYWAADYSQDQKAAIAVMVPSILTLICLVFSPLRQAHWPRDLPSPSNLRTHLRPFVSFMVISVVALIVERIYPIFVSATTSASEVALLAVVLRVMQLGLFGQSLATFYFSPLMAGQLKDFDRSAAPPQAVRFGRAMRWLSFLCAAPVLAFMIWLPGQVAEFVGGHQMRSFSETALQWGAVAVVAQLITGPSQAFLTLSGHERFVACIYSVGCFLGVVSFLGSSSHGAESAAFAIAITYSVLALGQTAAARRVFGSWV